MKWWKALLAAVAIGQLAIPAFMIYRQETTLHDGRAYKFKTRPVDPADAFRGRYVALGFEQDHAKWRGDAKETIHYSMLAYASVQEGADGFAVVSEVGLQPPASGDYFKVHANYRGWENTAADVFFSMPFDRYYMEEGKAPKAEAAYRNLNRRGQTNFDTYAVVRIQNGYAALEDLIVGGKPIAEAVK
jgi:uncharacterized membrane-anchored protein